MRTLFRFFLFLSLVVTQNAFAHQGLKTAVRAISPPFSYLTIRDSKQVFEGFTIDEWKALEKLMGIPVEIVQVANVQKRHQMLIDGQLDFIPHDTFEMADRLNCFFIPDNLVIRQHLYVHKKCTSVTYPRDLKGRKVAVIQGREYPREIMDLNPMILNTGLECLTLLNRGIVEVFVAFSEKEADYTIDAHDFDNVLKKGNILSAIALGILVPKSRPELAEKIRRAILEMRRSGELATLHKKWFGKSFSKSGMERYARIIGIALAIVGGLFLLFALWNFILRRQVNEITGDLQDTEERYRTLIESSPDMIFLVDENGDIFHANVKALNSLKFADANKNCLLHMIQTDDVEEMKTWLHHVFINGAGQHEFKFYSKSGHILEIEIAGAMLKGYHEKTLACLFARNVTERNHMENELFQAERLAIIGKMSASIAHEINNPLSIIQLNAEKLLSRYQGDEKTRKKLTSVLRNAERAGTITKSLLNSASPAPIERKKNNLKHLIKQAVNLMGRKAKNVHIHIHIQDGPLYLYVDAPTMLQVLMNLLFNAIENMDQGKAIHICGHQIQEQDTRFLQIVVSDQGSGIAKENLWTVFEPFYTSRKGGFGLGLFITRRIVQRNNGIIYAESQPGRGTSMIMEFECRRCSGE